MQQEISDDVKIGSSVTPFQSVRKSPAVDKTASDFESANLKIKKIRRLIERGIYDADIARYIPGTLDLVFQGILGKIMTIEQPADTTFSDKEILDFELILDNNYSTNLKSLHLCFPISFRKLSNAAHNLDANIEDRQDKFANQIDSKYVYRIPLQYICDLGKIIFPTKIDLKIRCTLQTNMKQLFESKKR